jgi:hypothetical protein
MPNSFVRASDRIDSNDFEASAARCRQQGRGELVAAVVVVVVVLSCRQAQYQEPEYIEISRLLESLDIFDIDLSPIKLALFYTRIPYYSHGLLFENL